MKAGAQLGRSRCTRGGGAGEDIPPPQVPPHPQSGSPSRPLESPLSLPLLHAALGGAVEADPGSQGLSWSHQSVPKKSRVRSETCRQGWGAGWRGGEPAALGLAHLASSPTSTSRGSVLWASDLTSVTPFPYLLTGGPVTRSTSSPGLGPGRGHSVWAMVTVGGGGGGQVSSP